MSQLPRVAARAGAFSLSRRETCKSKSNVRPMPYTHISTSLNGNRSCQLITQSDDNKMHLPVAILRFAWNETAV